MKRPIVIEFSGLPNSGKTTLLCNMKKYVKNNNVNALIMQEAAELFQNVIPKGDIAQNLWITLETLQKSLEIIFKSNVDFILLDRGFYNQLFLATMYKNENEKYFEYIKNFMEKFAEFYDVKPDYLYVVDVDIDESIRRRMNTGGPVTFSKENFLKNYKAEFKKFYEKIDSPILYVDTTNMSEHEVADSVYKKIITL